MEVFKDILPSIMENKKDLSKDSEFDKSYNSWLVNRALSYHYDCILHANQVNMMGSTDENLKYQYLLNSIRPYKRSFQKWHRKNKTEDISLIMEYYTYSYDRAIEALSLLSEAQILEIRNILHKGGINNDNKHQRSDRNNTS